MSNPSLPRPSRREPPRADPLAPGRPWRAPTPALFAAAGDVGLGLLVWAGISTALLQGRGDAFATLRPLQNCALLVGAALAIALGAVLVRPLREARTGAPYQRALATLFLAVLAGLVLLWLLARAAPPPGLVSIAGAVLCIAALSTIGLVAHALEPDASPLLVPAQLALALAGGSALFFALMALFWPGRMETEGASSLLLLSAFAASLLLGQGLGRGGPGLPRRWLALALLLAAPLLAQAWPLLWPAHARPAWWLALAAIAAAHALARSARAAERAMKQDHAVS